MKQIVLYARNDVVQAVLPQVMGLGARVLPRNPRHYSGEYEPCDEVIICPGSPKADAIRDTYEAHGIPVRIWGERTEKIAAPAPLAPQSPPLPVEPPEAKTEVGQVIDKAVKLLFGKARSHGMSKQQLRKAIEGRGIAAVAEELGVELSPEQFK